jgi:hypothetical protein
MPAQQPSAKTSQPPVWSSSATIFALGQQEQADPQESPYFDSLCRTFLLGVGAGALVETVHMVGKLVQTPDVAGKQLLLLLHLLVLQHASFL